MGFLGKGQPAPPHQLGGLRERCKLPQRSPGRSPGRRRVFLYSEPSDCLSQHLRTCCIQFAWLGIRFFLGGYTYQYPPHKYLGCQIPCIPPLPTPVCGHNLNQIKSYQFISETADSKIEIHDNNNVQPFNEVRKGCCQR